jgi:hypothetical protein
MVKTAQASLLAFGSCGGQFESLTASSLEFRLTLEGKFRLGDAAELIECGAVKIGRFPGPANFVERKKLITNERKLHARISQSPHKARRRQAERAGFAGTDGGVRGGFADRERRRQIVRARVKYTGAGRAGRLRG